MNRPTPALPISLPLLAASQKRRVLLIDTSTYNRDLRAEAMRRLGMDVDCAADIVEARSWWRADLYDLVLINMEKGRGHRDTFCDAVRHATPPQRLAFFVGHPEYLADAPSENQAPSAQAVDPMRLSDVKAALSLSLEGVTHPWGILEASRRISAVRAACHARTQAMRDRPAPPRDCEGRPEKRRAAETTLPDLLKERMQ